MERTASVYLRLLVFALGILTAPLEVAAQAPARVPVTGVLSPTVAASPMGVRGREAFEKGLTAIPEPILLRADEVIR